MNGAVSPLPRQKSYQRYFSGLPLPRWSVAVTSHRCIRRSAGFSRSAPQRRIFHLGADSITG
jgi:hypothetical protein